MLALIYIFHLISFLIPVLLQVLFFLEVLVSVYQQTLIFVIIIVSSNISVIPANKSEGIWFSGVMV